MIKPRIGGHPIHIILVHFPSGLYPLSVVCATLFYYNGNTIPGHVAFYTMAGGTAMAWLAILFGLWESFLIPATRTRIITAISWHALLNGIVTILFTAWTIKTWRLYPALEKDSLLLIIFKWVALILLIAGNYIGGKLLLKYHVGISKTGIDNGPSKLFNHLD